VFLKFILYILLLPVVLLSNSSNFPLDGKKEIIDEKSCLLVDALYKKNAYNYQINLDYGKCAYFRGDVDRAMAAYDRADIIKEEDAQVHKNLGDLHAFIGNIEIANSEYDKADRFGKDTIERSLDSLYSTNSFSMLARLNVGYDSNVKYNAENMQNWDVNSTITPSSDTFAKEYFRLNHTYDRDALTFYYYKNQLHVYNKNYSDLSEDDFTQVQLYSGPGWASESFDIWIPLSYTYMATDYKTYSQNYSINPQFRKRFENRLLLKVEAEYEHQKYLQWSQGDKDLYSTYFTLSKWFGSNYFRVAYRYLQVEKDVTDSPRVFIDRKLNEVEINYVLSMRKSLEFGAGYLYGKTKYSNLARFDIEDKREDTLQKYSAYMSYNITKSIGFILQYDNYINDTNYTPSNYNKEVLSGGMYVYY